MKSILASVRWSLRLNQDLIRRSLDGLFRDELERRCGPDSSSPFWIFGHVTVSRFSLARLIGIDVEEGWLDDFRRGSRVKVRSEYPTFEELDEAFRKVSNLIYSQLEVLTEEELDRSVGGNYPVEDKTVRGVLAFFAYHETYHLGQLAYLRHWLGHDRVVG